ncbi:MAG: topoisomerase DNA-binding C4 zinc finger domain-containing protein, partial [Clostridia bacterium]|nr:topoisomerase DNA-binding C4 zinc finger domain-containing protein [Clostridia bacterium]
RFIASLMANCIQNTVNVDIDANGYTFKASGYSVKFDGFTCLYIEGKDEAEESTKALPELSTGDVLTLKKITPNQHFTQPPSRFTEASLIKILEESGIGRPSTFATTVSTIVSREYVEREKKLLIPTKLGIVITELLSNHFPEIVDQKFTAKVESELDAVESGDVEWKKMLSKFYKRFNQTLSVAEVTMDGTKVKVPEEVSDVVCEKCGNKMVVRSSRFGKFLACPAFPKCKNTKPIITETPGACPKCNSKIIERKSSKGYKFFACEKGKDCGFITWDTPTANNCPKCGKTLFKRRGGLTVCNNENCDYEVKTTRKKAKNDE